MFPVSDAHLKSIADRFTKEKDGDWYREIWAGFRWPTGVVCPRCGNRSISEISTRSQWDCNSCRYRFSATSGTALDNTKLPIRKWFAAVELFCAAGGTIKATELQRLIDVTYRTAWRMLHVIREAIETGPTLLGIVELEGGHVRDKSLAMEPEPTWVIGAVAWNLKIRVERLSNTHPETLRKFIDSHRGSNVVLTEELQSFFEREDAIARHETVYADVPTRRLEDNWSFLRESIIESWFGRSSDESFDRALLSDERFFNEVLARRPPPSEEVIHALMYPR